MPALDWMSPAFSGSGNCSAYPEILPQEPLPFLCRVPLFACYWTAKSHIIKFDDAMQLVDYTALPHNSADAPEHGSGGFEGRSNRCRQLNG